MAVSDDSKPTNTSYPATGIPVTEWARLRKP